MLKMTEDKINENSKYSIKNLLKNKYAWGNLGLLLSSLSILIGHSTNSIKIFLFLFGWTLVIPVAFTFIYPSLVKLYENRLLKIIMNVTWFLLALVIWPFAGMTADIIISNITGIDAQNTPHSLDLMKNINFVLFWFIPIACITYIYGITAPLIETFFRMKQQTEKKKKLNFKFKPQVILNFFKNLTFKKIQIFLLDFLVEKDSFIINIVPFCYCLALLLLVIASYVNKNINSDNKFTENIIVYMDMRENGNTCKNINSNDKIKYIDYGFRKDKILVAKYNNLKQKYDFSEEACRLN